MEYTLPCLEQKQNESSLGEWAYNVGHLPVRGCKKVSLGNTKPCRDRSTNGHSRESYTRPYGLRLAG
jgi:hypothetical protein